VLAAAAPPGAAPAGAEPHATTAEDTAQITADQVVKATDLHQTVRLDAADLQYALAELSPEDVLREREGIDEAFLRAGAGIEEPKGASENVVGKQPEPGG
jgi:hypothetical protein